jgi:hypothetical protein
LRLPRLSGAERQLALLFALALPLAQPTLRGEGNGHYAWAASVLVDGDLDLENQYRQGDPDFVAATFRRADGGLWPTMETPTGLARNQFSIGPAVLWLPALIQARALVLLGRDLGLDLRADGYSRLDLRAAALATAVLGSVGLLLGCRLGASIASPAAAAAATAGVWLASSLPIYLYALPFYSHALAAFALAAFLAHWRLADSAWTAGRWAAWGALAGLMIQVDAVAASFLAVAAAEWLRQVRRERSFGRHAAGALAFSAGALLAMSPQFAAYAIVHGSPFDSGRFHRFFWDEPHLLAHAFGAGHGVFLWTPLTLVALLGMAGLARRERFVAGTLLVASAIFYYVVASSDRWHTAPGFGDRFLVALSPVWVVGLTAALHAARGWLERRGAGAAAAHAALAACLALAALWNAGLAFQWGTGLIARRETTDFRQVVVQQFTRVPGGLVAIARGRKAAGSGAPGTEPSSLPGRER